jgi:hypothetical protein
MDIYVVDTEQKRLIKRFHSLLRRYGDFIVAVQPVVRFALFAPKLRSIMAGSRNPPLVSAAADASCRIHLVR